MYVPAIVGCMHRHQTSCLWERVRVCYGTVVLLLYQHGWIQKTLSKSCARHLHACLLPYTTYYKPIMYYKLTLFSSKFLYKHTCILYYSNSYISQLQCTYYKPTPLFRVDVREIAHGLILSTIRYMYAPYSNAQLPFR